MHTPGRDGLCSNNQPTHQRPGGHSFLYIRCSSNAPGEFSSGWQISNCKLSERVRDGYSAERTDSKMPAIQGGISQDDLGSLSGRCKWHWVPLWRPRLPSCSTVSWRRCLGGAAWTPPLERLQPRATSRHSPPQPHGIRSWAMLVPQGLLPALPGPLLHFITRREGLLFPLYTAGGVGLTLPRPISNRGGSNSDHPSPGARFPEASLSLAIRWPGALAEVLNSSWPTESEYLTMGPVFCSPWESRATPHTYSVRTPSPQAASKSRSLCCPSWEEVVTALAGRDEVVAAGVAQAALPLLREFHWKNRKDSFET